MFATRHLVLTAAGFVGLCSGQIAFGQVMLPMNPYGNFSSNIGGLSGMNGSGLSQQQFGTIMGLRALQGMGHHGVQTGVANPFMNDYGAQPQMMAPTTSYNGPGAQTGSSKHHPKSSKREEAKAARAEQKRLAAVAKAKTKTPKANANP